MQSERAYVDTVVFNSGTELRLEPDSITVFVGPNNAGKSQALRDIYNSISSNTNAIITRGVTTKNPNRESFIELLEKIAICDGTNYRGFGFNINQFTLHRYDSVPEIAHHAVQQSLFALLDTTARLSICEPPGRSDYNEPKRHPILFAAFDDSIQESLSSAFKRAFGQEINPNLFSGSTVPLYIGPTVVAPGGMSQSQLAAFFNEQYKGYQKAHEQGDGMRSFLGVLLYLVIDYYRGLFIDEPEAFLHPPQAAILGSEIANNSIGRQVFLATHSKELLGGLLSTQPDRVKVVRITRAGNSNDVSILSNSDVSALSETTLLKYSDVVNSLFHESVALCESDADCKFYSAIADKLRSDKAINAWPLLLPTGGKQRMKLYVEMLNRLRINVKVIPDIDVLNNRATLKDLVLACGGSWEEIESDYSAFSADLVNPKTRISIDYFSQRVDCILSECDSPYLEEAQIEKFKKLIPHETKWTELKKTGRDSLKGNQRERFDRIDTTLRKWGIHIVRVGELECFVKEVTGHGPAWVNEVFEKYPDLSSHVYGLARDFVKEWLGPESGKTPCV